MLCSHSFSEWPKSNKEWKSNHHWEECLWGQTSMTIKEPGFKNYKKEWRDTCTMATFSHYERFDMQLYFSPFFFYYVPTVGAKCPLRRLKAMATLTEMYTITVTQIINTNTEELSCGKHWACWQLPCAASSLPHSCWSFAALCGQWVDWIVQKCSTASLSPHHPPHHRQGAAIRPSHTAIQERFISLVWLCSVRSVFELQGLFLLKKKELQGWEQTVWSGNSAQLFPCKY